MGRLVISMAVFLLFGFIIAWGENEKVLKIDRSVGRRVLRFDSPYGLRVVVAPSAQIDRPPFGGQF
jgi:hypothetical protein